MNATAAPALLEVRDLAKVFPLHRPMLQALLRAPRLAVHALKIGRAHV